MRSCDILDAVVAGAVAIALGIASALVCTAFVLIVKCTGRKQKSRPAEVQRSDGIDLRRCMKSWR